MSYRGSMSDAHEQQLKEKFAEELLRNPGDPFKAGLAVFGMNTGRAMQAAQQWATDPYVMEYKDKLLEERGVRSFLPTKEDLAREIIDFARAIGCPEDKIKAFRLYGEVMGFIEKPAVNVNNNTNIQQNSVMVIKDHGTDDEWEAKLATQQRALVNAARH